MGAGRKNITVDMTPEEYKLYKKRGYSNNQIVNLAGISVATLNRWVRENDLLGYSSYAKIVPTAERTNPGITKKRIDKFNDLYNKGWRMADIAEEMGMSPRSLRDFLKKHCPEYVRKSGIRTTEEEKQKAKEAGISVYVALERIRGGWDREKAFTTPKLIERKITARQHAAIERAGLHRTTIYKHLRKGLTFRQAMDLAKKNIANVKKEKGKQNEADKAKGN